jgi:NADH oxidase (H2O2-forming)
MGLNNSLFAPSDLSIYKNIIGTFDGENLRQGVLIDGLTAKNTAVEEIMLVEILPNLLANSFDIEFSAIAEETLKAKGVTILAGICVEEILGSEKIEKARLSDGREIPVDSIILGVGGIPNTKLATDAELDLGKGKGIWVDEYMRTVDPDIFAAGDCAGKRDFYTRKDAPVMLASTATAEARIAGANLYQ